jgi:hypothetical protein
MKFLAVLCTLVLACAVFAQDQVKKEKAALAKVQVQRDNAKKALDKHPGNATLMHSFVGLNDNLANRTMNAEWLTPHDKYAGALRLYRVSLKVDPKDSEARKWVDMIESIYRSMKRPIPQ